jgi:hypothetical protein
MPTGFVRRLIPNVLPFWVHGTVSSLGTTSCTDTDFISSGFASRSVFIYFHQGHISAIVSCPALIAAIRHAIICSILCSIFLVWRYNIQDPIQWTIQPLLTPVVLCCVCV